MYCFGVDIGGTAIKIGVFQTDGTLLEKWEIRTRTEEKDAILSDVATSIVQKMQDLGIDKQQVVGVGAGVPAPVEEGGIVRKSANLGWGYKNVKQELQELLQMDVELANDANIAALGEVWMGGGVGHKNLVMITLGTGVGGGLIFNEKILAGYNGAAGEVGHMTVNREESQVCGCGRTGCLEQYASATGLVRLAKRKLTNLQHETVLNAQNVTAKSVFEAVKVGDSVAKEVATEFGEYLGRAMANMATLIDPSVFVIGGGVSKAGEPLLEYIKKPYMESAFFANKNVTITLAKLGNDAGIYGAAKLILHNAKQ